MVDCFVVDDHPNMAQALSELCMEVPTVRESWAFSSAEAAFDALDLHQPQLIICDIVMPTMPGAVAIAEFKRRLADVKILVVTGMVAVGHAEEVLACEIDGIIAKGIPAELFVDGVAKVLAGKFYSCPVFASLLKLGYGSNRIFSGMLTKREREVARGLAKGMSMAEVGQSLNISYKTVDCHRGSVFAKFHISSQRQLMQLYHTFPAR